MPAGSKAVAGSARRVQAFELMSKPNRHVTHYSPTPNTKGPRWFRVAVCGVETRIGDETRGGSSNLRHVSCPACLEAVLSADTYIPPVLRCG